MEKREYEKRLMELIDLSLKREESIANLLDELKNLVSRLEEKSKE